MSTADPFSFLSVISSKILSIRISWHKFLFDSSFVFDKGSLIFITIFKTFVTDEIFIFVLFLFIFLERFHSTWLIICIFSVSTFFYQLNTMNWVVSRHSLTSLIDKMGSFGHDFCVFECFFLPLTSLTFSLNCCLNFSVVKFEKIINIYFFHFFSIFQVLNHELIFLGKGTSIYQLKQIIT